MGRSAADARPFPWQLLAPVSREQAALLRSARRWATSRASLDVFAAELSRVVRSDVDFLVRRIELLGAGKPWPDSVGVVANAAADGGDAILVEAEAALAAAIVARVLDRPRKLPLTSADPRSPSLAGAFAAVLVAAARRANRGGAPRVVAAGSFAELAPALARFGDDLTAISFTVLLDHDAFAARVVLPRRAAVAAPPPPWTRAALAALGPTPLSIPVVALAVSTTAADMGSLAPGDMLVASPWPLRREGHGLRGPVHLAAPDLVTGIRGELVEDNRLVLRGEVESLGDMGDADHSSAGTEDVDALVESVGEVPVVVRVELGQATMTARQWAALGKGDVLTLGKRVGENVVLRVGGVPVATGELVEVEGEVGVRIVARAASDTTKA